MQSLWKHADLAQKEQRKAFTYGKNTLYKLYETDGREGRPLSLLWLWAEGGDVPLRFKTGDDPAGAVSGGQDARAGRFRPHLCGL